MNFERQTGCLKQDSFRIDRVFNRRSCSEASIRQSGKYSARSQSQWRNLIKIESDVEARTSAKVAQFKDGN